MSSLQKSDGRITGSSPGNYCIVSFPATFGQDAWNRFLGSGWDLACVWTGNDNSPEAEWFVPWKDNVLKAHAEGMQLVVMGHMNCNKGGGRQCTHRDHSRSRRMLPEDALAALGGDTQNMRFGNGQVMEIEWLNEQSISYLVYAVNSAVSPTAHPPPSPLSSTLTPTIAPTSLAEFLGPGLQKPQHPSAPPTPETRAPQRPVETDRVCAPAPHPLPFGVDRP